MCCALRLLHFWFPIKAQDPENKKVYLEKWKRMVTSTWSTLQCLKQIKLKKTETLPSNNQHCNEETTNRWNWTTFAIARNPGNKKVYLAKWKKNSGINMIDFTVFEKKKKTETLPSNNQHCIEKKKILWNWTTFALVMNKGIWSQIRGANSFSKLV